MPHYSSTKTVTGLLRQQAETYRDKDYLIDPNTGRHYSYEEYDSLTSQVASILKREGVAHGDRICLVLGNSPMYNIITHGVQKAGAVAVLVNTGLLPQDVLYIAENSSTELVITDRESSNLTNSVKTAHPYIPIMSADDIKFTPKYRDFSNFTFPDVKADDGALVLYTSGTTGKPKGAMLTHLNVMHNAEIMAKHNGMYGKRGLNIQPPFYTDGQILMMLSTLSAGGSIVQPNDFTVGEFWKLAEKYATHFSAVMPTNLSMLLNESQTPDKNRMEFLLCSAAALSPKLHEEFERTFGVPIVEGYGLTEAGSYSTCNLPVPKSKFVPGESNKFRVIGSVGKPIGNDMRIVDPDTGSELKQGDIGEILIRGPNVMKGYLNNTSATTETVQNGWLYTGDLGNADRDNNYFIKGRKKDMVVHGGQKVFAREVEDVLYANPYVKHAAIIPTPHDIMGEDVKALVVLRDGAHVTERELMDYCRQNLAAWKSPTHVQFIESMPLSSSGKILKRVLIERYGN